MPTKSKLSILFISRAWGGGAGGMERLSLEMLSNIKKSDSLDVEVVRPKVIAGSSLTVIRIRSAIFGISVIPRALLAARGKNLVHIGDPVLSLAGWLIQTFLKVPVVVNVHGLDIVYPSKVYQLYLRLFFDKLSAYMPISEHVKNVLKKRNVRGTVRVVNPGMNDEFYDPSVTKDQLLDLIDVPADKFVLFTSGRLVKRKGHAWFIQSVMPYLPSDFVYVIAGSGSQKEAIEKAIAKHDVQDRVILLGRVSHDDLTVLYNTVDVFVQPNVKVQGDIEGFGLVLLEAASCNRLVMAHNIEGMTDAIHHEKNGLLVPYQDVNAWVSYLQASRDNEVARKARQYTLDTFLWTHTIENYEKTFRDLRSS